MELLLGYLRSRQVLVQADKLWQLGERDIQSSPRTPCTYSVLLPAFSARPVRCICPCKGYLNEMRAHRRGSGPRRYYTCALHWRQPGNQVMGNRIPEPEMHRVRGQSERAHRSQTCSAGCRNANSMQMYDRRRTPRSRGSATLRHVRCGGFESGIYSFLRDLLDLYSTCGPCRWPFNMPARGINLLWQDIACGRESCGL